MSQNNILSSHLHSFFMGIITQFRKHQLFVTGKRKAPIRRRMRLMMTSHHALKIGRVPVIISSPGFIILPFHPSTWNLAVMTQLRKYQTQLPLVIYDGFNCVKQRQLMVTLYRLNYELASWGSALLVSFPHFQANQGISFINQVLS